jgi:hypothetical protein
MANRLQVNVGNVVEAFEEWYDDIDNVSSLWECSECGEEKSRTGLYFRRLLVPDGRRTLSPICAECELGYKPSIMEDIGESDWLPSLALVKAPTRYGKPVAYYRRRSEELSEDSGREVKAKELVNALETTDGTCVDCDKGFLTLWMHEDKVIPVCNSHMWARYNKGGRKKTKPSKPVSYEERRAAAISGQGYDVTVEDIRNLVEQKNGCCGYCFNPQHQLRVVTNRKVSRVVPLCTAHLSFDARRRSEIPFKDAGLLIHKTEEAS